MAKWGSFEFKEFLKLQKQINGIADNNNLDELYRACAKELAARLLAKVIPRTPVGRKPILSQLGEDGIKKTFKVKGASGKSRSFLTRGGAILAQHWGGYSGGTLRRGWTAKTEGEARQSGASKNPVAYSQSLPVTHAGGIYTVEVINPVHYASYVEYGHRQQPGRFVPAIGKRLKAAFVQGKRMLTISEVELEAQMPKILERKILEFFREAFND